jgi:hypothetical protein
MGKQSQKLRPGFDSFTLRHCAQETVMVRCRMSVVEIGAQQRAQANSTVTSVQKQRVVEQSQSAQGKA